MTASQDPDVELELATKACTKCGEEKPLTGFYRQKSTPDGRRSSCAGCVNRYVKRRTADRRKEMGEEAWQEHRRQIQRRHRETGGYERDRLQAEAYNEAMRRVREAHRAEFEAYYREARYDRGLPT